MSRIYIIITTIFLFINFSLFANNEIALITKSKGIVDYKSNQSDVFIKDIKNGLELYNDDLLKTGEDGFVMFVYLDDGSLVKIHKNSEIYIRGKIDNNKINKRLSVGNGIFRFDVKKQQGDEFTVVTPSSVASVKGTDFMVNVGQEGDLFYGFDGFVEVKNKKSNVITRLSKNNKIESLQTGNIILEPMTEQDFIIVEEIEIESGLENIDEDNLPDDEEGGDAGESDQIETVVKELKIKISNSSGDEKEIIIRYTE